MHAMWIACQNFISSVYKPVDLSKYTVAGGPLLTQIKIRPVIIASFLSLPSEKTPNTNVSTKKLVAKFVTFCVLTGVAAHMLLTFCASLHVNCNLFQTFK